jgi:hypothetical protein
MIKFLGHIILVSGLLTFFFLIRYKGSLIEPRELWVALSLVVMVAGAYLVAKQKFKEHFSNTGVKSKEPSSWRGKRLTLTLDNCEVKVRSFLQEVHPDRMPTRMEMMDSLYDSNRGYKTEEIRQTYLVVEARIHGTAYKFISGSTHLDPMYVRQDLAKGRVSLVFNPNDPTQYRFKAPFL